MRFLVTNDDGVGAVGLELLARSAAKFGDVVVVAPSQEQSGISHRLTFDRPLKLTELKESVFQVDGSPADCVRVAIARLGIEFDWVLSGVNDGANLGVETYYSGTVAAAREATVLGIPAIALSQYRRKYAESFEWNNVMPHVDAVVANLSAAQIDSNKWINVNFPDEAQNQAAEIKQIPCEPDFSPLPANYVEVNGGVELQFRYSDRPKRPGLDIDVCFGGDIAVSHHTLG